MRASRPIEKGELITICKVPALLISVLACQRVAVSRGGEGGDCGEGGVGEGDEVCEGGEGGEIG